MDPGIMRRFNSLFDRSGRPVYLESRMGVDK